MSAGRPFIVDQDEVAPESWTEADRPSVIWRTLLSGDRTPTDGLTLGVAELSRDGLRPVLHRHAQGEAYYVLAGEGRISIDGVERELRPGVTAFIPSNAWHAAWATSDEPLRLLYVFAADSFTDVVYEFADSGEISDPASP